MTLSYDIQPLGFIVTILNDDSSFEMIREFADEHEAWNWAEFEIERLKGAGVK